MKIFLQEFRSYKSLSCEFPDNNIYIYGPNGAGKTNLLESISLFSPGKGMRNAQKQHLQKDDALNPWRAGIHFDTQTGPLRLETFYGTNDKRMISVNTEILRSQTAITQWLCINWITPAMDRLFIEGMSQRRKFFDRVVFSIFPDYARHILRYEKAIRERSILITNGGSDSWCEQLEKIMFEENDKIKNMRIRAIEHIEIASQESVFTNPLFKINHNDEDMLLCLRNGRKDQAPTPSCGAHKAIFNVFYQNGKEASICSTGEQKSLLISIVMSATKISIEKNSDAIHILLLDEIFSHIDETNRELLFLEISRLHIISIMTGTHLLQDKNIFQCDIKTLHSF